MFTKNELEIMEKLLNMTAELRKSGFGKGPYILLLESTAENMELVKKVVDSVGIADCPTEVIPQGIRAKDFELAEYFAKRCKKMAENFGKRS